MLKLVRDKILEPEHDIDLDDLAPGHSLTLDPTVVQLRQAAKLHGEDMRIAVTLPGEFEGAEGDPEDEQAITQWTTVVIVHPRRPHPAARGLGPQRRHSRWRVRRRRPEAVRLVVIPSNRATLGAR